MTNPSTTRRAGPYIGTGVLVSYPFEFKVFDKTDVTAVVSDSLGIESDLVIDSSALVTLNIDQDTDPGGSLQYAVAGVATALPVGYTLAILSAVPYAQQVDLPEGGNYRASDVEGGLDALSVQIQQIAEQTGRALTLSPLSGAGVSGQLPAPEAGKVLGWNLAENALINLDSSGGGGGTSLPTIAGQSGKFLSNDGSNLLWTFGVAGGGMGTSLTSTGTVDATGVVPCSAALNTLLASGGEWYLPAGTYLFDSTVAIPDNCVLRFAQGAVVKPNANGLTLFTTKSYSGTKHAFLSQVWNPYFDSNGKTGVIAMDMTGLRHAAGIYYPRFSGAFNHCIILRELCWDCVIEEPFAQGCVNGILIAHGSNAVQVRKPGIDGLGSAGYGIKIIGGATYPTTSVQILGGYVQGFSGAGGVGVWDGGSGTALGTYGTSVRDVYFELCAFADIYWDKSYYASAIGCQHYVASGSNANYGRDCEGVRIYAPLMTSGARSVGLYNFDTSNVACYGDRPINTGSGINLPLGTVTGIGTLPTQDEGTFTPTVSSSAGANTGITYATQLGRWTRIGSRVTVTINIKWSGWTGPAGNVVLRGVPVALEPVTYSPANLGSVLGLMPWTGANLYAYMNGSGRDIVIAQNATAGTSTLLPMAANGELAVDLTYIM